VLKGTVLYDEVVRYADAESIAQSSWIEAPLELGMTRRFFGYRSSGYGSSEAPYWFIGPEQGRGPEKLQITISG